MTRSFRNITIQGTVYDMAHLNPFRFTVTVEGRDYVVGVEFSAHCFTEELKDHHTPDYRYTHDEETRAFDIERHRLSHQLPIIIGNLDRHPVYHTHRGTFLLFRMVDSEGASVPYLAFFDAIKASNKNEDVRLIVQSAYMKPNMAERASPVKFSTLVKNKANRRPLNAGPVTTIRR